MTLLPPTSLFFSLTQSPRSVDPLHTHLILKVRKRWLEESRGWLRSVGDDRILAQRLYLWQLQLSTRRSLLSITKPTSATMGVPALFRWLSQKYPKIISNVLEEQPREVDGVQIPVDTTQKNPNGEEMDNLYLDMNGIVHPCSHPEDKPPPTTEAEMMLEVFKYTDRVVNMCRPRKLLMIAVGMS